MESQDLGLFKGEDDVFLNNETGDFFTYDDGHWLASGNAGLHWVNALGDNAKIVKTVPTFKKKQQAYQPLLNILKMTDVRCFIKTPMLNHWLGEGLS